MRRGFWGKYSRCCGSVFRVILVACLAFLTTQFSPASADPASAVDPSDPVYGRNEAWAGVDASNNQWLAYSGLTATPWSKDIYTDGWRVRIEGAYGQYSYQTSRAVPFPCGAAICFNHEAYRAKVDRSYFDALVGYYIRLGSLTAKAFAGAAVSTHQHETADPKTQLEGTAYGGKAVLELWWNVSDTVWTSLDGSYATTFNEASGRWRAGWRVAPQVSIGPELRYDSNISVADGWTSRAGLFARYAWTSGEVSLAGGLITAHSETGDDSGATRRQTCCSSTESEFFRFPPKERPKPSV
jgi:hypothetical protein